MGKKFYLINMLLLLIVVLLAVENYDEWTKPEPAAKEGTSSRQRSAAASLPASVAEKKEAPAPAQFRLISDKNIFSPDRKEFPIPLLSEVKKPPVRPNITLFGVVIGEGFQSAVITNPTRRADKGERETMTVKEGQKVGEYKVAKVLPDRITLESPGDSFDVLLYDPTKQKKRPVVAAPGSPPAVSPGSPAPARPYTPPGGTPPLATPPRPTPPPAVVNPPTPQGGFPGRNLTRTPVPQRRIPTPPARTQPVPVPEEDDDEDDDDEI